MRVIKIKKTTKGQLFSIIIGPLCTAIIIILIFLGIVWVAEQDSVKNKTRFEYATIYFYSGSKIVFQDCQEKVKVNYGELLYSNGKDYVFSYPFGLLHIVDISKEEFDFYVKEIKGD